MSPSTAMTSLLRTRAPAASSAVERETRGMRRRRPRARRRAHRDRRRRRPSRRGDAGGTVQATTSSEPDAMQRQPARVGNAERRRHPGANAGVRPGSGHHDHGAVDAAQQSAEHPRQRRGHRCALDHLGVDQLAVGRSRGRTRPSTSTRCRSRARSRVETVAPRRREAARAHRRRADHARAVVIDIDGDRRRTRPGAGRALPTRRPPRRRTRACPRYREGGCPRFGPSR